jgi:DNA-directed RNA polymerase specialized sigma24 family protein
MTQPSSDTTLLGRLRAGRDEQAAQELWRRYFNRLVGLARTRLRNVSRRTRDEEDIALSAFNSFFRGVENGRFPELNDRDDLWQVLMLLTERKAVNQFRREKALKRGGGKVRGDSYFAAADAQAPRGLDEVGDARPSPELAAVFTEECRRLFHVLDEPELRVVALLKMEGFTNEEIARSLDRVPRSVERKLRAIRKIWLSQ